MNTVSIPELNDSLTGLLKQRPRNFESICQDDLTALLAYIRENPESESQSMMGSLLTNALDKRFQTGITHEHIYLKNDETTQIQLFNILIEKFPFVKYSQLIANNAIIETMADASEATIIDIGIGQGTQVLHIIELAKKLPNLKTLHITGIEPFADALQKAAFNINACRETADFKIEFTGINKFIEEVDFSMLQQQGKLIVNASLALHHIQSQQKREEVIAAIRKLDPKAFLLIEPNVDHFEKDLSTRFINCYHHYYNIFKVIDRLDIDQKDKNGLKLFFGREIDDVIGKAEEDRYEKHETAKTWISRLERHGFSLNGSMLKSPVRSAVGVEIAHDQTGYLGFTNDTETVLAVMYAQ